MTPVIRRQTWPRRSANPLGVPSDLLALLDRGPVMAYAKKCYASNDVEAYELIVFAQAAL